MASRTSAALSGSVARSTLSEKALCRQWAGFSVCGRSNAFGFDTPCSRGFGNKGLNGGDFALDAAPSGCPPLALHRWLATPQGASAPASSRCVGSAWKPGASRQRPSPTTSRRIEAISPRLGWANFARCAPTATTGSTVPIARAHPSARTAPLPTRTTPGTGQARPSPMADDNGQPPQL